MTTQALPSNEKLYLAHPTITDMPAFLSAAGSSHSLHHPWVSPPGAEGEFAQYLQRMQPPHQYAFLIKTQQTDELVGVANLSEIVYGVFQSGYLGFYGFVGFTGQGLMTSGLSLLLEFYFKQLKLHRLEANIQPANHRSINLVKRLKFRREGFSPRYLKINNQWQDHERYAITMEDFCTV